jgi:hypothetical protein
VIARTWSRRVRIRTSDKAVFQAVRYLECDPEIAVEPASNLAISIESYRSYYRIVSTPIALRCADMLWWYSVTNRIVKQVQIFDANIEEPLQSIKALEAGTRKGHDGRLT